MKIQLGGQRSRTGEAGIHLGRRFKAGKMALDPYVKASLAPEFATNNKVRFNDKWDFNNSIAGNTGRYGAGIDATLSQDTSLFAEMNYLKGKHIDSPLSGNVGLRLSF